MGYNNCTSKRRVKLIVLFQNGTQMELVCMQVKFFINCSARAGVNHQRPYYEAKTVIIKRMEMKQFYSLHFVFHLLINTSLFSVLKLYLFFYRVFLNQNISLVYCSTVMSVDNKVDFIYSHTQKSDKVIGLNFITTFRVNFSFITAKLLQSSTYFKLQILQI